MFSEKCQLFSVQVIQFLRDTESEFEKFVTKFINNDDYSEDYTRIATLIKKIFLTGALKRYFRPERRISDSLVAIPSFPSKLRLYCLRLSDKILILGNGGIKKTQKYEDDNELRGYVMTLQKFESLLKEGENEGSVIITETEIETDNIFEI